MTLPDPFAFSLMPHERRHGPAGYQNYQDYKPWLRDEFVFRCVYCLEREAWYPNGASSFSVEHAIPQSADPTRICDYANLLYACTRCNSARLDVNVLDPTKVGLGIHLRMEQDGTIKALTVEGQDLIDLLHLDTSPALRVRRRALRVLSLKQRYPHDPEVHQEFLETFGFPTDLPNLALLKPPAGNTRPENLESCYWARRQRAELAEVY